MAGAPWARRRGVIALLRHFESAVRPSVLPLFLLSTRPLGTTPMKRFELYNAIRVVHFVESKDGRAVHNVMAHVRRSIRDMADHAAAMQSAQVATRVVGLGAGTPAQQRRDERRHAERGIEWRHHFAAVRRVRSKTGGDAAKSEGWKKSGTSDQPSRAAVLITRSYCRPHPLSCARSRIVLCVRDWTNR
jgi:hypothetical protein